MNQNFVEYVKSHIKEYLPTEYQNAVISINEVTKSNDRMLTGLTILLPGEQAAPTIYLEALAEQVERGMPLDTAMKQIAQIQLENYSRVPLNIDQSRINRELIKEYSRQIAQNEQQLEQIRQYKMKLYESMVNGFLDKAEFIYNKSSYSARITQLEQAVAALKEKRTDVMENRSERNRWIENFRRFSDLEELDRKAVIQLVQVITVLGKDELQIQFNYQDEYEKALALITPVQERMVV